MKNLIFFLLALAIFAISIILGANNNQVITFNYLFTQREHRISTLIVLFFFAGFVLGCSISGFFYLRSFFSRAREKNKIK